MKFYKYNRCTENKPIFIQKKSVNFLQKNLFMEKSTDFHTTEKLI